MDYDPVELIHSKIKGQRSRCHPDQLPDAKRDGWLAMTPEQLDAEAKAKAKATPPAN